MWSKEPKRDPSVPEWMRVVGFEPGWYWHRWNAECKPRPRYVDIYGHAIDVHADVGEWWPIPITPPASHAQGGTG